MVGRVGRVLVRNLYVTWAWTLLIQKIFYNKPVFSNPSRPHVLSSA